MYAQELQVLAALGADECAALANAAGKYEGIYPTQHYGRGSYPLAYPIHKGIDRDLRSPVALVGSRNEVAHFSTDTGDTLESALAAEYLTDFGCGHAEFLNHPNGYNWVDVARSTGMDDAG